METTLINHFIRQFKLIQDSANWTGENFRKKLEQITEEEAFTKPIHLVHSVAEQISHIWMWRLEALRRLQGGHAELEMNSPLDWRNNKELMDIGWDELKSGLYKSQSEFIHLLKSKNDHFLEEVDEEGDRYYEIVEGVILHDMYHLGQIGLTIKLLKS